MLHKIQKFISRILRINDQTDKTSIAKSQGLQWNHNAKSRTTKPKEEKNDTTAQKRKPTSSRKTNANEKQPRRPDAEKKPRAPKPKRERKSESDVTYTSAQRTKRPLPPIIPSEPCEGKIRFTDIELHPEVLAGIQDLGFSYCTPVQAQAIPTLLQGKDIIGKSQTGTGKTAAFLSAIFDHFVKHPIANAKPGTCRALVLAPTRELAIQIHKDAEAIGKYTGCLNTVVFGGMDHKKQMAILEKNPIDILIGTPGRLLDYIRGGQLRLQNTEVLVIDEADRMLDMGFIPDVTRIVSRLPPAGERHTLFFSATFTPEVMRLTSRWLSNPTTIEIESEHVVTTLITQKFYSVLRENKFHLLLWFLRHEPFERVLVFGNRKDFNFDLTQKLKKANIKCDLLSGDVPQEKRLKVLERFRDGDIRILVATDVAARGIDVKGISHVINYDLPEQAEDYVHRIGRTGRAGVQGTAISFICEYGAYKIEDIEKYIGNPIISEQPTEEMLSEK